MSPEKDMMVQIGFWATLFAAVSGFWWKLSSRFVKKDIFVLYTEKLNETLQEMKKDSLLKWKAITKVGDETAKVARATAEVKGLLQGMCDNRKKRKDD